jgi:hypothetical protein
MTAQSPTAISSASRARPASIAEVVAISLAWPCALAGFVTGLMTDNTGLALIGLASYLATWCYALVRATQVGRAD